MTTTVEKICVGGGQSYFPDELLLDMNILDCSKDAEDDIPQLLTLEIIKEIIQRIKTYVKNNKDEADADINEHMFQLHFHKFSNEIGIDRIYDYAQSMFDWEKHRILFDMTMQAYADAIDHKIFE